ncbi:hypothetical protein WMY93_020338 [Mugilogobius chulae]|uniref:BHLH domain-containing protein n=1 Tax=Mugilogobius chulae TaxID=88201 RepID=A0AAW0NS32_9GOBI
MTKTLPNPTQEGNRSRKRRLQNPKIEKAEILDLAVEYLHKWTSGANDATKKLQIQEVSPPRLEPASVFTMESAGFKQCMVDLASYVHKISPAQRTSLIEGLKRHVDMQPPPHPNPELEQRLGAVVPMSLDSSYSSSSERKDDSLKFPFLHSHSFSHSPHCSTPLHDYISPPHSPWFSPLSTYSPPLVTYACHFTFPPTPPSSNSSLATLAAPVNFTQSQNLHVPLQPPPRGSSLGPVPSGDPVCDTCRGHTSHSGVNFLRSFGLVPFVPFSHRHTGASEQINTDPEPAQDQPHPDSHLREKCGLTVTTTCPPETLRRRGKCTATTTPEHPGDSHRHGNKNSD